MFPSRSRTSWKLGPVIQKQYSQVAWTRFYLVRPDQHSLLVDWFRQGRTCWLQPSGRKGPVGVNCHDLWGVNAVPYLHGCFFSISNGIVLQFVLFQSHWAKKTHHDPMGWAIQSSLAFSPPRRSATKVGRSAGVFRMKKGSLKDLKGPAVVLPFFPHVKHEGTSTD